MVQIRVGAHRKSLFCQAVQSKIEELLSHSESTISSYVELKQVLDKTFDSNFPYFTLLHFWKRRFLSKLKVPRKTHIIYIY